MKQKPPVPDDLSNADKVKIWKWFGTHPAWLVSFGATAEGARQGRIHRDKKPAIREFLRSQVEQCLDYHGARGNPNGYVDWRRACQNWIRKAMDDRGYEPYRPPSSTPSTRGKAPFESGGRELETMDGQLRLIAGGKK